jgi:hypothetical protein
MKNALAQGSILLPLPRLWTNMGRSKNIEDIDRRPDFLFASQQVGRNKYCKAERKKNRAGELFDFRNLGINEKKN